MIPFCTAFGDREQHDEVERAQLRELALAREAEGDHEEAVDEECAQDLLGDGDGESEHVVPHGHARYDRATRRGRPGRRR